MDQEKVTAVAWKIYEENEVTIKQAIEMALEILDEQQEQKEA